MYVIGLTGMIASGKSTVSEFLRQRGIVILDADKISHQVILKGQPAFEEIILYFGADCLGADGQIDRRKLGRIVFSETEKLEVLNRIVHPRVTEEIPVSYTHLDVYKRQPKRCSHMVPIFLQLSAMRMSLLWQAP